MTSLGSRSGVNWMRLKVQPIARARLLASIVLPTPGTSSISRWPWQARPISGKLDLGALADDHLLDVVEHRLRSLDADLRSALMR